MVNSHSLLANCYYLPNLVKMLRRAGLKVMMKTEEKYKQCLADADRVYMKLWNRVAKDKEAYL